MQLCYVRFLRGEPREASPCVARLAQVARQHGLFHASVVADMFSGWVATEAGCLEEGLHTAQKAFKILRDAKLLVNQFSTLPIICEVLKRARLVEDAIGYINDLLTIPREDSYESFHPELWRLKGDFLVLQSENSDASSAEAEKCFCTAIAIAQKHEAKLYELKAATGLCELYKRQGRRQKAGRVLQPVLSWFAEGHETRALKQAKNSLASV